MISGPMASSGTNARSSSTSPASSGVSVRTAAFGALGPGPTCRELRLVARVLRSSGDEATLALFDEPENYGEGYRRLCEIAERVGASSFVALDLYCDLRASLTPSRPPYRWGSLDRQSRKVPRVSCCAALRSGC